MILNNIISKVAVAVTVICVLLISSCDNPARNTILTLDIKKPSVSYEAGQVFVAVGSDGSWTLHLTDEDGSSGVDWASLNITSGTGSKNNIILSYKANAAESARSLYIVIDDGASWTKVRFSQSGIGRQPEDIDQEKDHEVDVTKVDWLELPAMDNENLGYFSHNFQMGNKKYRNYSFGWSQDDLVALWVAYPLCSMYTNKSVSRTNAWAYDPLLGQEYSSAPFGGYGGWYARGHQIPSADRLCCYEANAQTFYGTNMTPQLNGHNEGIWQTMEGYIRNMANTSDTTYVVTGCVVKGSKEFTQDSDGKKMTVPTAYYKAVLRYSKSSTLSKWAALAFYTEHKDYGGNTTLKSIAIPVDELEKILNMDLFVNLPAKLGEERAAELEAEDPRDNPIWDLY